MSEQPHRIGPLAAALLFAAVLGALSIGCDGERDRLVAECVAANVEAYPLLWGQEMSEPVQAQTLQTTECMWDHLESAGHDPVPAFDCTLRSRRALVRCLREHPQDASTECFADVQTECREVPGLARAGEACRRSGH